MLDGRDFFIEQPTGPLNLNSALPGYDIIVMDIGFGTGEATAQMALDEPQVAILAVDVHTPGIGDLLHRCAHTPLPNVRVMSADALEVLTALRQDSLAGVRTYFPDPWPKARHHKRRLIQRPVLDVVGLDQKMAAQRRHVGEQLHGAVKPIGFGNIVEPNVAGQVVAPDNRRHQLGARVDVSHFRALKARVQTKLNIFQ